MALFLDYADLRDAPKTVKGAKARAAKIEAFLTKHRIRWMVAASERPDGMRYQPVAFLSGSQGHLAHPLIGSGFAVVG